MGELPVIEQAAHRVSSRSHQKIQIGGHGGDQADEPGGTRQLFSEDHLRRGGAEETMGECIHGLGSDCGAQATTDAKTPGRVAKPPCRSRRAHDGMLAAAAHGASSNTPVTAGPTSNWLWRPHHDELVHPRLGTPHLAGSTEQLTHLGPGARQWEL